MEFDHSNDVEIKNKFLSDVAINGERQPKNKDVLIEDVDLEVSSVRVIERDRINIEHDVDKNVYFF